MSNMTELKLSSLPAVFCASVFVAQDIRIWDKTGFGAEE